MEEKVKQQYDRWLSQSGMPTDLAEELKSIAGDEDAITDRFYRELEFGTGGLRGVIGSGTNRMNVYNIRKATQGLANYLHASDLPKKVAIGYDSRIKSDVFAKETAAVLAANGIKAYIYPRLEPTPALSWAVRYYGCGAGVCVTASHNPAKYNGYKVYGADGCQITLEVAAKILAAIEAVDCFAVQPADFDAALAEGKIEYSSEKCLDDFVDAVYAQRVGDGAGTADLKLVDTPLNGSGLERVKKLLAKLGVTHVTVVPEQEKPDGYFPSCPNPYPEIREAMQNGLELCDKVHPDLLLGTDPDCDRCGTAVPDGKGGYRLITGNEMGVLLLDYIITARRRKGTLPENAAAISTIVTSKMVRRICDVNNIHFDETFTGFKFMAEKLAEYQRDGSYQYVLAFEESYGYMMGDYVRDKDAVTACVMITEMAAYYFEQGMTLAQALDALYEKYGFYGERTLNLVMPGLDGLEKMRALMAQLRREPLQEIAGTKVVRMRDYQDGSVYVMGLGKMDKTPISGSNVLYFELDDGCSFIVRPSGTEPKIKVYILGVGATRSECDERVQRYAQFAETLRG